MQRRSGVGTVVGSVALAGFMVFVLGTSSLAGAAPATATGSATGSWAYGFVKSIPVGPALAPGGWVYEGNATIGYSVVLSQQNTSSGFELTVNRTVGASFAVEFCTPSCKSPTSSSGLNFREWESSRSFINFTTSGKITEASGIVPALAITNSTSYLHANVSESAHSFLAALPGSQGVPTVRERYLAADLRGSASVAFAPALDLLPLSLGTSAQNWSATSAFAANATITFSYYYAATGGTANSNIVIGPDQGSLSMAPSGNVSLRGSYSPASTISFGGTSYPALEIGVTGPFAVGEGFVFIPAEANLFGGESEPWASNESGEAMAQMSTLDAKPTADGHFGVAASSWLYTAAALNPADGVISGGGLTPSATALPNPVTNSSIQGVPQPVDQAQSANDCLISGSQCPNLPGHVELRSLLSTAISIGAVIAVVSAAAVVIVHERRRLPPPAYPNARLYPPGAVGKGTDGPGSGGPEPTPGPATEEDPLDHLW